MSTIRRAFADLSVGQVHYAACGDPAAPPVLLLHQSPRSWNEYRAVLPLIGARRRAIAMDTAGFGDSADGGVPASSDGGFAPRGNGAGHGGPGKVFVPRDAQKRAFKPSR